MFLLLKSKAAVPISNIWYPQNNHQRKLNNEKGFSIQADILTPLFRCYSLVFGKSKNYYNFSGEKQEGNQFPSFTGAKRDPFCQPQWPAEKCKVNPW